jgi:SIR2-like domain
MNTVLLTGAGFTKTFGGYLASEMWATILNQPEVQRSPNLLKRLRDVEGLDYEMLYEEIQSSGTGQQRKELNAAIRNALKEMDDNIRTRKPHSLARACCQFISRIVLDKGTTFIFTLNQDMFFERFYGNDKNTVIPGLPNHLSYFKEMASEDSSNFSLRLPTADELELTRQSFKKELVQIAYVKLHGSQGWLSHEGSDMMVIGTQKASIIENEPLLKWYFSLFEEALNRPDTRLLVIGYSFRDKHINERIVEAIDTGLKLYVISPESPQNFKTHFVGPDVSGELNLVPCGNKLWNALMQYWPTIVTDFYSDVFSDPARYELKHKGRALLKTLKNVD